jgi:hypothetical protein
MNRLLTGKLTIVLSVVLLLLPITAMAEEYSGVVEQILIGGKNSVEGRYLEFLDGEFRQYAVARPAYECECLALIFIQEHWTKSGEKDVIDQWIVQVGPVPEARHRLLIEDNSLIVEMQQLSSEGAEDVAKRIAGKALVSSQTR